MTAFWRHGYVRRSHIPQQQSNNQLLQIRVYPRASIDLSRRVRQLAHLIQGTLSSLVGKRIVPLLPRVMGAWLAGLYDNDRPVQRCALESFTNVFSTETRRSNVWKIYLNSTLDFIDDVLLHQTPLTLSDERTTKRDDAEAKYARVAGTALLLLNRILGRTGSSCATQSSCFLTVEREQRTPLMRILRRICLKLKPY